MQIVAVTHRAQEKFTPGNNLNNTSRIENKKQKKKKKKGVFHCLDSFRLNVTSLYAKFPEFLGVCMPLLGEGAPAEA